MREMRSIMKNEFEVVKYPKINNVNTFVVNLTYRTPHLHRDIEINLVLDGQVSVTSKTHKYAADKGELLVFCSNQPHELFSKESGSSGGVTLLCLQVSPQFFKDMMPNISDIFFDNVKFGAEFSTGIPKRLAELAVHYISCPEFYELYCGSAINSIFHEMLLNFPHRFLSGTNKTALQRDSERILRFIDYVEANYMHKISLQDFSESEGVSLSHMSYFIRKNLNQTFQEYVTNIRFNHAHKLLISSKKRLIDICFESGFSDSRYLTKAFLQKTGMKPEEYRATYVSNENNEINQDSLHPTERICSADYSLQLLNEFLSH